VLSSAFGVPLHAEMDTNRQGSSSAAATPDPRSSKEGHVDGVRDHSTWPEVLPPGTPLEPKECNFDLSWMRPPPPEDAIGDVVVESERGRRSCMTRSI
jgi:hypothetical protein